MLCGRFSASLTGASARGSAGEEGGRVLHNEVKLVNFTGKTVHNEQSDARAIQKLQNFNTDQLITQAAYGQPKVVDARIKRDEGKRNDNSRKCWGKAG